jgi:hypothetical protein
MSLTIGEPWEFGTLGIYDFNSPGPYSEIFSYLNSTKGYVIGDILEAGTYRGRMALAFALWLRQSELNRTVHTFDTFSGFPEYSNQDDFRNFWELYRNGDIDDSHFKKVKKLKMIKTALGKIDPHPSNLSNSGDFSQNSLEILQAKIDLLNLQNLKVYKGNFRETMTSADIRSRKWWLVFIDCDLYSGYKQTLSITWENVQRGGMVFLDEYFSFKFPGARIAVNEFLNDFPDVKISNVSSNSGFSRWALVKE